MKIPKTFVEYIEASCNVDRVNGALICAKCGCPVCVDWFEKELECSGCDDI